MQSILVRFLPATNTLGNRVVATCRAGRKVVPCRGELNGQQNADRAAMMLATELGWTDDRYYGPIHRGTLPNEDLVYVITDSHADGSDAGGVVTTVVRPGVINDNRLMSPMHQLLNDIWRGVGPGWGESEIFAKATKRGWIRKNPNGHMYVTKRGRAYMLRHGI